MPTAADILVDTLIDWRVKVVFGLPGDGINGIMEALRTRQDRIRFVQVRHEESAAFMACGYAKWTGDLGVCLATSGPGGAHLSVANDVQEQALSEARRSRRNRPGHVPNRWFEGRRLPGERDLDEVAVLERAFAADGPVLVEAVVDVAEPMMPPKMPPDYAGNFRKALPDTPHHEDIEAAIAEEPLKTMIESGAK